MAAIEQELLEQFKKLDMAQKKQVLDFVHRLTQAAGELPDVSADWENQPWMDEEIRELMRPRRKTMKALMEWLDANPPIGEWGGMKPEDDPAEFIHNLRRQHAVVLEDPGEPE
jgi:mRNA-degrading endonuclease RelE of RelBE toxin-antitoxin system